RHTRFSRDWSSDVCSSDLALPAAIYTTDAQGRITFYNEAAVTLSGRRPILGSDEWCVTWRLYRLDGSPMRPDECPMAVALKEGEIGGASCRGQRCIWGSHG